MNYKMIIFDADDTLYDFGKAEEYAFNHAMVDMKLPNKKEYLPIYEQLNQQIWKEFEQGRITQEKLKVERFNRFLHEVNLEGDATAFSEFFMDNLAKASFLFDGAMELVESLSTKYRLVLITNGLTRVQKYRVRGHELSRHFETVIISEEIGYAKPDPMIFVEGLKDLAPIDKKDIMIVGDSLSSDILGGINFGIDTCWFNPKNKVNKTGNIPTYEIHKLDELYTILV